jgi:hypothetical protein
MVRSHTHRAALAWAAPVCVFFFCCAAGAEDLADADWSAASAAEVVEVLTVNEDGSTRETKIWIVVTDGEAYIRTGRTRWYGNVQRNPDVVIRSGEAEFPFRAELVTDEGEFERVQTTFREKYGSGDWWAGLAHLGGTRIMRLVPRP